MLDLDRLQDRLPIGRFGRPLHAFQRLDSTNRYATELAAQGEPEGTLVLADEQTHGRGRAGRRWLTPPGSALAFSVILRPERSMLRHPGAIGILGALAVVEGLAAYGVEAQVKWPNDVLISRRKVAGVLPESVWAGGDLEHVVLGIGINVHKESLPTHGQVDYPATTVEQERDSRIDRIELLNRILNALEVWYPRLGSREWILAWDQKLAFRGEWVQILQKEVRKEGILKGVSEDGDLQILDELGRLLNFEAEDGQLRPVDRPDV